MGFDTDHGLSSLNSEEAHLNQNMVNAAKKAFVMKIVLNLSSAYLI